MARPEVIVVRTGVANVASVVAGLLRAGGAPRLTSDAEEVRSAERVVLPGVGAFAAGMSCLRGAGLDTALKDRIAAGRATLAVCLGLQLLCEGSEEDVDEAGLGVLRGCASRFPESVSVPQLGWNRVEPDAGCRLLRPGYAYFANSYRLANGPVGWPAAYAEHGGRFVAAVETDCVLACQFHPELSGTWGTELLGRWLAGSGRGGERC
ncbi:MAG: imidazole glycerol phosphate synthase subunit HisH [Phycisphaerae bacterium]|jgi:imidazole glycerol phosphate synthase glutamine amidotransferase subunit